MADPFSIRFWGTRGSTPVPGSHTLRYGGESTCFEVRAGDALVVIDCGSGARNLGAALMEADPRSLDLLFTHIHLDHICGLPFFKPAFDPRFRVTAWAGHFSNGDCLADAVGRFMMPPVFPVSADLLKAVSYRDFPAGSTLPRDNDGLVIRTTRLNHPGGACGYRFDFGGQSICILTDHEHGNPEIDAELVNFAAGADIMVCDTTFTDAEYPEFKGWGHSTWQQALKLAEKAGVRTPVLFHHSPGRSDDDLDEIAGQAEAAYPGAVVARQGMVLQP